MTFERKNRDNHDLWMYDVDLNDILRKFAKVQSDCIYCLIQSWGVNNNLECDRVEFLQAGSISEGIYQHTRS